MFKLLLLLCVESVLSANILYLCATPSPSHHIWNRALAIGLANKGHNVTLMDPDQDKLPKPVNFTHIVLKDLYKNLQADSNMTMNDMADVSSSGMLMLMQDWCIHGCAKFFEEPEVTTLLNYPSDFKFDLILIDVTAGSCLYPMIHRFHYPPTVAVTAFLLPSYVSFNFGNQMHPSYVPWYGLPYSSTMSFLERVWNHVYSYVDVVGRYLRQYKMEHDIAKAVFGEDIPTMYELERHISLVLTNTDPILDHPQPLAPNFIPVGGLHTRKAKSLPQDLQTLLDNAKHGVIVFSLGTNVRSDKLDKSVQKALLDAFRKIKETVIWKFESDIENLPKNVIISKWLPQNDILGHPNVKLFIGHGGALSTQESIFHGVPMICIPFIIDQHINTRIVTNKKLGVSIDFKKITAGYVLQKLREVLDNPIYTQNMKKISSIYSDRMETPLERAVFWAEYVLRHGGAQFLNSPARDMPFYAASGIDVVAFLALLVLLVLVVVYKLLGVIVNLFPKRKQKVKVN